MRSKKIYAAATTLVLLLALAATSVVWAQGQPDEPPAPAESTEREDAVNRMLDEDGTFVTPDERVAKAASENEGGFGGYYFEKSDPGHVFVYMLDPTKGAAARTAFAQVYEGSTAVTQVTAVQGDYAFDDLVGWFRLLDKTFVEDGLPATTGAVMEVKNRIRFGMKNETAIQEARGVVARLGIPAGAVIFEKSNPVLLGREKDDLDDEWRRLVGGVKHHAHTGMKCTIGFTTSRDDVDGLVIASHCTNQYKRIGGIDYNVKIHQSKRLDTDDNWVASEEKDPLFSESSANNSWRCPDGYECRYSDAAFAKMVDGKYIDQGEIAQPEALGEDDVDPAGSTFEVTSDTGGFSYNEEIHWVGYRSGWQAATVEDTCDHFEYIPGSHRLICVGLATVNDGSDAPRDGDSGAPVFKLDGDNGDVELVGTLFARNIENSDQFFFSPVGNIYLDLGPSLTWDSCVSSC